VATPTIETAVMAWDPAAEVIATISGPISKGASVTQAVYEVPPYEVVEVYKIMCIPFTDDTGKIYDAMIEIGADSEFYPTIHIDSTMMPADHPLNPSVAIDLGVPLLHYPITGRVPSPFEATTLKFKPGQKITIKVTAREDIPSGLSMQVILRFARLRVARGFEYRLRDIVGTPVYNPSFELHGDMYIKPPIPIDFDRWDELPGGLRQSKPKIDPWVTFALNKVATTPNKEYYFDYPDFVDETWMDLSWNLINKEEAYLIKAIGVHPHDNLLKTIIYVEGRPTRLEFYTRPLPGYNYFFPAMTFDANVNKNLKRGGPRMLDKPYLFHGVKGGIAILDNGTSVPAYGVRVQIYGVKFTLR